MDSAGFFIALFAALTFLCYQVLLQRISLINRKEYRSDRRFMSRRENDRRVNKQPFILFDRRNSRTPLNRRKHHGRRNSNLK